MANKNIQQVGYGLTSALPVLAPYPVAANRAPTVRDTGYPLGQLWIYAGIANAWVLVALTNGQANWSNIEGGAGDFSSLTVDPGPVNLVADGAQPINVGVGSYSGSISIGNPSAGPISISALGAISIAGSGAGAISIGGSGSGAVSIGGSGTGAVSIAGSAAGTVTVGNAAGTGTLTFGSSSNPEGINIASGSGAAVVRVADSQVAGSVSIGAGMVAGTISLGGTAQTGTITIGKSTAGQTINVGNAAGADTINIGNANTGNITNLQSPITALPGPVYIYTGAGAPGAGLALHVGDLYINTTAASATTRLYIATAASTWTNVTCAA